MNKTPIFPNYSKQIKFLTKNPQHIKEQWINEIGFFKCIGTSFACGCLTQIKGGTFPNLKLNGHPDYQLVETIMEDERLPETFYDISVKSLKVFKEYNEFIDLLDPYRWTFEPEKNLNVEWNY